MTVLTVLILFTNAQTTDAHKNTNTAPRYVLTQLLQQLLGDAGVKQTFRLLQIMSNTTQTKMLLLKWHYCTARFPSTNSFQKTFLKLLDAGVIHTFPDFQNNKR
uniref:Uncharacterized protein n=1 Tax=Photinus pyralis TaxID=7054 RepID=A0A1Y1MMZ0_PHOPY